MSDTDFVKVFATADHIENGIIVSMLQEHGIESVVMNKQDSAYVSIGEIELYVASSDKERALELIHALRKESP